MRTANAIRHTFFYVNFQYLENRWGCTTESGGTVLRLCQVLRVTMIAVSSNLGSLGFDPSVHCFKSMVDCVFLTKGLFKETPLFGSFD